MEAFAPQLLAIMGTGKEYLEPALVYLRVRALSGNQSSSSGSSLRTCYKPQFEVFIKLSFTWTLLLLNAKPIVMKFGVL